VSDLYGRCDTCTRTRLRAPADSIGMYMERDRAGRLHIEDDGVSAIVGERGESSFTMTATASRSAMKRVCDLIGDMTRWPTMPMPRIADEPVDFVAV